MNIHRPGEEQGFTLIELAMVAFLLAVMSTILYGSLGSIMRTKQVIEGKRGSIRTAQYVLSRMTRELTNRVPQPFISNQGSATGAGAASASATPDLPKLYFLGKNLRSGDHDADSIRFSTAGSGQVLFEGATNYGVVEVEYRLQEATAKDLLHSPENAGKSLVLVREEVPAGVNNQEIRAQRRIVFPVSEQVESLNLRYRKNGRWLDEWSEKRQGFPDAVEITIGVRSGEKIEIYRSAVMVVRDS